MQNIRLDAGAAALLARLHGAGYAAYAVGGCVRDSLLGRTPQDWDLCTSARPEQVLALFGEGQCIPTGLQHGTVTIKYGGQLYETTTFRTEGAYTDGRHPDEVHFVPDVRQDLARRDFTINAMAYNDAEGLIDPFGGQQDLQQGILRAVGDPATRFEEDALRILRLYRFAARFGFAIDPPTGQAARALCAHLDCVSVERIEEELSKLLAAPAPEAYLDEKILKVIIPELSAPALQAAKPVVDACPAGTEDLPVRWAALLMSLGEDGTRKALKRLRCSNACIEQTAVLKEAEELLSFDNFVLGIGGVSTFKSSHLREDLPAVVPMNRIVLETDSPYMAPVPYRGKRNESAFVVEVLKTLAKAYGVSEDEFAEQTNKNVESVFHF